MNSKDILREEIRKIFKEIGAPGSGWYGGDVSMFHGSGSEKFPYGNIDTPENLSTINKEKNFEEDEFYKLDNFSNNKDIYEFPMEEFHLGLEIEMKNLSKYNSQENILDIGHKVLSNLQEDPRHYSKLKGDETNFEDNK